MPMIAFFPWTQLREPLRVGRFHLFPVGVGDEMPEGVARAVEVGSIAKVLSPYRTSPNQPIGVHTLVQVDDLPVGLDLDETRREDLFRFARHLAVSCLAGRRFSGHFSDNYTAGGHYQLIIQSFQEPYQGGASLSYRRKGGHANVMMTSSAAQFFLPPHLVQRATPEVDEALLSALQNIDKLPADTQEGIRDSVVQFLVANTDSPDVPPDAESIATYAALERLAGASQRKVDFVAKVPEVLSIANDHSLAAEVRQALSLPADSEAVREWLNELYKLRGHTGHGKPGETAPQGWAQFEHLVAGAFVYPLALKCLLAKHNLYRLRDEDVLHTVGLPRLLESRPFYPPSGASEQVDEIGVGHQWCEPGTSEADGWVGAFERLNYALLGIGLSSTLRSTYDDLQRLASQPPQHDKA